MGEVVHMQQRTQFQRQSHQGFGAPAVLLREVQVTSDLKHDRNLRCQSPGAPDVFR